MMVITDKGMIIRTPLDQILTIGRDTQGVCIIKLNEGHLVSSIAVVPKSEDEEEDGEIVLDLEYKFKDEKDEEENL